ncbi:MAG: carboxypeptidase-like regulatory domain-containing protein [Flavobacteriaceae bacterium]|nr:carboxypeptidase-like regulatory domain-containing protein [Flavobacteriaceae bacterium]
MKYRILTALFLLLFSLAFAQQGTVSGILTDDDGVPLPGVRINVKGTSKVTQTDFDGNYSLECHVGDVLVFAFIGMKTREVLVTQEMFGQYSDDKLEYISVKTIHSNAYSKAIKKIKKKDDAVQNLDNSSRTYNKSNVYFQYNRIKDIDIQKDKVKLTYFSPDIYYELGYDANFGLQFVRNKNLPELQNTFSQGVPVSGELAFQGPETGNIFSYGPSLKALEFDGSNFIYDSNGQLVPIGNGNGVAVKAYDNSVFENVMVHSNQLFFNVSTDAEFFGLKFRRESAKDIYQRERSFSNKIRWNYKKKKQANSIGWNTFLTYQSDIDKQPNINGFQNNLLLNLWATPASFSNRQVTILPDNSQRSFSSAFNNPEWLLDNNRNSIEDKSFIASIQSEIDITDDITLGGKLNYRYHNQEQKFGLPTGTTGFANGFVSDKEIRENSIHAVGNFKYSKYNNGNEMELKTIANYTYDKLDFSFLESSGFEPFSFADAQNNVQTNQSESRSVLRLLNQFKYELDNKLEFKLTNNSYYSSLQNDKWFLPSLYAKVDLKELFGIYGSIHTFSISSNFSLDVNDTSLYYKNLSHNSLLISPQQSLSYTANNDLFIKPSIELEEIENFEANLSFGLYLLGGTTDFGFTYYHTKTKGSVFPMINNGGFVLDNVADIRNSGFECNIDSRIRIADDFYYKAGLSFSTYDTKVLKLLHDEERIPIAGFSTTSKNLIVGQAAGVIVGSAYVRDEQNNLIIADDGFPIVHQNPQIIGDPVPDYNIGFSNHFEWKNLDFNVVVDIQKGGDIWNGTQNALNYLGTSQQSSFEREITNFVFSGVDQQGDPNAFPVDFYNPNNPIFENRFVRYGFEGVAEDAIVDASYINIKSIDVTYSFRDRYNSSTFFRECKLGLYAKNLFTWSQFSGNSPYGALYGNRTGQELHFFNTPLISEVGLTLKLKL